VMGVTVVKGGNGFLRQTFGDTVKHAPDLSRAFWDRARDARTGAADSTHYDDRSV